MPSSSAYHSQGFQVISCTSVLALLTSGPAIQFVVNSDLGLNKWMHKKSLSLDGILILSIILRQWHCHMKLRLGVLWRK